MKISVLFFASVVLSITSCAPEKKKAVQLSPEQTKQLAAVQMKISVDGMVCSACQSTVKKTVKALEGVKEAEVSLENKNAFITYYPNLIKPEQIKKAINDKGYTVGKIQEEKQ